MKEITTSSAKGGTVVSLEIRRRYKRRQTREKAGCWHIHGKTRRYLWRMLSEDERDLVMTAGAYNLKNSRRN